MIKINQELTIVATCHAYVSKCGSLAINPKELGEAEIIQADAKEVFHLYPAAKYQKSI